MNATWAVHFAVAEDVTEAIRLWPFSNVEVCESDGVWFRGSDQSDAIDRVLRGFLNGKRFRVDPDGQLIAPQHLVPQGRLPVGPWIASREWMQLELPSSKTAGTLRLSVDWELIRDDRTPSDATALLTTMTLWCHYALQAPRVRLKPLQFACDASERVIIWGTPLPPIPGTQLVVFDGIAVPCGQTWYPSVAPVTMCHVLGISAGDFALLYEDGSWDHVRKEQFVAATRESVRATSAYFVERQEARR